MNRGWQRGGQVGRWMGLGMVWVVAGAQSTGAVAYLLQLNSARERTALGGDARPGNTPSAQAAAVHCRPPQQLAAGSFMANLTQATANNYGAVVEHGAI